MATDVAPNKDHFISYPEYRRSNRVVFKLNSDDYSEFDIRHIGRYLREKGYFYKYHRQYSQTKLISWGVFSIQLPDTNYISDSLNESISQRLVASALSNKLAKA